MIHRNWLLRALLFGGLAMLAASPIQTRADDSASPSPPAHNREHRYALLIGDSGASDAENVSYPLGLYGNAGITPSSFYLGLTADIGYCRTSRGAERIDSIFFDFKSCKSGLVHTGYYNIDVYSNSDLTECGIGLQRRFVSRPAGSFRTYAGMGVGAYVLRQTAHGDRTDYTPVSFNPAIFAANHTSLSELRQGIAPGAKLMLGLQHSSGAFLQADLSIYRNPDRKTTTYFQDDPVMYFKGLRIGYRF